MSIRELPTSGTPAESAPAAPAAPRPDYGRASWLTFLAIAFIYVLSVFVPWKGAYPIGELDPSWVMVLHWTHDHHVDFGRDFAFTYGPWGYILQGYQSDTYPYLVAGWTLLAAAYFAGLLKISRRLSADPWVRGFFLLFVTAVVGSSVTQVVDVRLFSSTCLVLLLYALLDDLGPTPVTILMVAAVALASEVKFSNAVMAGAVLIVIAIDQIRRKRVPWPLLIFLVCYLLLWSLAGQSLGSLAAYIRASLWITGGYAQGEGYSRATEVTDTTWFIFCTLPLLAIAVYAVSQTSGGWMRFWAVAAGLPLLLMVIFKAGYTRHDDHEMEGTVSLALLGLLIFAAAWPALEHPAWRMTGIPVPRTFHYLIPWALEHPAWRMTGIVSAWRMTGIVSALAPLVLCWTSYYRADDVGLPGQMAQTFVDFPANVGTALQWMTANSTNEQTYQKMLQDLRDSRPLPAVHGTVDIYSYSQGLLLANGLQYRPRPVFQSYLAYTPELEQLNADSLTGPLAPDSILFDVQTIDTNFPSSEDGLAWPQILTHYDLKSADKTVLLLEHSAEQRDFSLIPSSETSAQLGAPVPVPDSEDPVWVRIDLKPSLWGRIAAALDKPPVLILRLHLKAGADAAFRFVPGTAAAGFLLSPYVDNRMKFALLQGTNWANDLAPEKVASFTLSAQTADGTVADYDNDYSVSFSNLVFPHRDISAVPGIADFVSFRDFLRHLGVQPAGAKVQLISIRSGLTVLLTPGETMLLSPPRPGAAHVHVKFGILNGHDHDLPAGAERTNGVQFQVFAFNSDDTGRLAGSAIWTRRLDPNRQPGDVGMQEADIDLGATAPKLIGLATVPATKGAVNFAYWAGVQFKP